MQILQSILDEALYFTEGFCALAAIIYFKSVKKTYWKYFVFYLAAIFLFESLGRYGNFELYSKIKYYNNIVIPFQFIFFFWLYGIKSLKSKTLFWILSVLYLISFIPSELYFKGSNVIYSFNYTFGCLLLMILVILEYYKQINSDDIINFQKNRMFYINLGVTLFYIGTLPFWTFYALIFYEHRQIWDIYYSYNLISDIIMYLLFSISFVWGKQNSY
ncbi:hypothetical protein N0B16_13795 [Chryseobacterium sp. GMJ5]|uniref:Histidine kinase n=1 Tax=Chryseobacterium gilvum TaxID=2976534 RepID=A0ABT2VZS8_9FLAO|nr:hypothetical protein [Chryseobacterium gilvum]MCU7615505.1 hypothetical protein [Chryseobacterium gilvum]